VVLRLDQQNTAISASRRCKIPRLVILQAI
jgi:hypothetical protein